MLITTSFVIPMQYAQSLYLDSFLEIPVEINLTVENNIVLKSIRFHDDQGGKVCLFCNVIAHLGLACSMGSFFLILQLQLCLRTGR